MVWTDGGEESMRMAHLAFKGSPAHANEGKDGPTSKADDRAMLCPCACIQGSGMRTRGGGGGYVQDSEPGSAALQVAKGIT